LPSEKTPRDGVDAESPPILSVLGVFGAREHSASHCRPGNAGDEKRRFVETR
jgi:hypothetical protein